VIGAVSKRDLDRSFNWIGQPAGDKPAETRVQHRRCGPAFSELA
jgi:hypothetical protein